MAICSKGNTSFLSEEEIMCIGENVPMYFKEIEHLIVAYDEDVVGIMGIEEKSLEMLFIDNEKRGKGIGKKLIKYGIENYSINEVNVNEQNPQAVGFYEHMGFKIYKRTDTDAQGDPYPILYMSLEQE